MELKNRFAKTMLTEAKYSLVSNRYPIDLSREIIENLNFDAFKISKKINIKNLDIKDKEKLEY
ncbi:MAG TPA: hypothetical protein EYH54_01810 [Nautiliaceae bacterium]|nr:hypothetical protein [Nautiliaceae bacterium]